MNKCSIFRLRFIYYFFMYLCKVNKNMKNKQKKVVRLIKYRLNL
jgi:hypothetical protein